MSFDKETRNALSKMVAACRRLLTEDVTDQLRGRFGMHPDGTILSIDRLDLAEDEKVAAAALRELQDHFAAGEAGRAEERRRRAYDRLVLEISFTALNRLAALRLCEERGLVVECVRKGTASDGFRLFERVSGGALGTRHQAYRVFLEYLFDELSLDLGVLFDRSTPQSAVFPDERCLADVLAELNRQELAHLWAADETIGWMYQYFNAPEERKAMRDASQAPRNSRELAVRNQFFTPRYVVEFLTDNTLGCIWYEMRNGETSLKEECRYLVRRPNEVFLAPGKRVPVPSDSDGDLSPEDLLKQPVYIEHRPKKDPRDLHVLDPACGSGHFLLHASDLLARIYEEAWEDSDSPGFEITGRSLREDYESLDALRRAVPKLIVEHNLHGIDIDPRAVQIAALALWLRAQKSWKTLGLKPAERPRIERSNIVTAEPMPGEADMRHEFITGLKPRVLGQLVEMVFEKMTLAGEAGSLLKIEEEITDAVAAAKRQWLQDPKPEQTVLFPELATPRPQQQMLFDVKDITDAEFWHQAEDRILAALEDYAKQAENGRTVRRRLFAEDASHGFAFIDLCRRRYDVVLMNPPFGEGSARAVGYIADEYPSWAGNLLCAFVERAVEWSRPLGQVGAIYDRTANIKSTYEAFRRAWLVSPRSSIVSGVDLGWGVLDANVETTGSVLSGTAKLGSFIDVRDTGVDRKQNEARSAIDLLREGRVSQRTRVLRATEFSSLPNAAVSPDFPAYLIRAFDRTHSLAEAGYVAYGGYSLKAAQHNRMWWEIDFHRPPPFSMSMFNGAGFEPYTTSFVEFVVSHCLPEQLPASTTTVIRNKQIMGRQGLCFGKRGEHFCAQIAPPGLLFTQEGRPLPVADEHDALRLLGFLNTPLFRSGLNTYCGQHKTSGYVNLFPFPELPFDVGASEKLELAVRKRLSAERTCETDRRFVTMPVAETLAAAHEALADRVRSAIGATVRSEEAWEALVETVYAVDDVGRLALERSRESAPAVGISTPWVEDGESGFAKAWLSYCAGVTFGRFDVRLASGEREAPEEPTPFDPLPVCSPGMLTGQDGLSVHVAPASYAIGIPNDGVLVDDPGTNGGVPHRDDIVRRVREVLDLLWKDKAHEIEQEACGMLGVSDLRDHFRRPSGFFQDHLKRYSKSRRKAPIYWPLCTASGSYTIWIYYHRLTDQTLYAAVNKYVEPKIAEVERATGRIEKELESASGREATQLRDRLNEGRALASELRDLRQELLRIAGLPYKTNLNDGVIINAAPFHKLFGLRSWAKDTEKVWKKLEKGDYDWAHLAYTLWPDRVKDACRTDRSIAIAHGLEDLCEVVAPPPKGRRKKKGRKKKEVGQ